MLAKVLQKTIIMLTILHVINCQIALDAAIKYLFLDQDGDHLLSTSQLNMNSQENATQPTNQHYYYWREYQTYEYPKTLFQKSDKNKDRKLSFLQLNQIVKYKLKRHIQKWPKSYSNVLNKLKTQDYILICDTTKDQYLNINQFLVCIQAFLIHQFKSYPYKIKSLLYPNHTIGFDIDQFRQLLPKSRGSQDAENQIIYLFNGFQWPQCKIKQDVDLLIGPEQGKFLQPTIIYFYLDTNGDQVLDKMQAMKYFKNHGGEQAFSLADFSQDQQLDQAQLIAYFMFAMCIQDCKIQKTQEEKCQFSTQQYLMFDKKYQGQEAICHILDQLQEQIQQLQQQINKQIKQQQNQQKSSEILLQIPKQQKQTSQNIKDSHIKNNQQL